MAIDSYKGTKRVIFICVTVVALVLFVYHLYVWAEYAKVEYITIGQLLSRGDSVYGVRVNLRGRVADGPIRWDAKALQLRFDVVDGDTSLPVIYKGIPPDNFRGGVDFIVTGSYSSEGIFQADMILSKWLRCHWDR